MSDQSDFTAGLAAAVGAPNNAATQQMVYAWGQCESNWATPSAPYNYLNMAGSGGAGDWLSFSDAYSAGAAAGARLMGPGYTAYGYGAIAVALQTGDISGFANAVGNSAWGTDGGCIAQVLGSSGPAPAAGSQPASGGGGQQQPSGSMEKLISMVGTKGPGLFNLSETYPVSLDAQGWEREQSFTDWVWNQLSYLWGGGSNAKTPPAPVGSPQGASQAAQSVSTAGIPGLSDAFKGLSNMEKAAGTAVGVLTWITSPVHILRIGEVIVGGIVLTAGLILFIALLFPNLSRSLSSSAGALSLVMGPARAAKGLVTR